VAPRDAAREHVLAAHRETVTGVLASADAAAEAIAEPASRDATVAALESAIGDGLRASLVELLEGAVAATGRTLPAEPVPAPPYVVVTARGPLVRATVEDGRLVVVVRAFERDRSAGGYVRATGGPAEVVAVRFRRRP